MSPSLLRRWLPRLGALYVGLGLLAALRPGFEVFPFFSWFLFPIVPSTEPRYELVVEQLEGRGFEPAVNVMTLGWVRDPKAMDLWSNTQRLGTSLERGEADGVRLMRTVLEGNYLCPPSRYRVERVVMDPMERWQTAQVRERKVLATFDSGSSCTHAVWAERTP